MTLLVMLLVVSVLDMWSDLWLDLCWIVLESVLDLCWICVGFVVRSVLDLCWILGGWSDWTGQADSII